MNNDKNSIYAGTSGNTNKLHLTAFAVFTVIMALLKTSFVTLTGAGVVVILLALSGKTFYILKRCLHAILFVAFGALLIVIRGEYTEALLYFARLSSIVLASVIYVSFEEPEDILDAITGVLRVKKEYALSVVIALEFIPMIYDEFERIRMAERMRGLDISKGFRAVKMIIPVFISVLKRTESIEKILYIKCFQTE